MRNIIALFARNLFLLLSVATFISTTANAQTFNFQNWNQVNNVVFTVNAFRSVTVDKRGTVWVGSDLGGLYRFNNTDWKKINTFPDVTFRHGVPSNMAGDSNVWITSIGKTSVQAITGGAYLINTKTETVTQYGSGIAGGLSSRFANSLAMSSTGKTYVALAQSLTGTTTNQGGVFSIATVNPPVPSATSFTKAITDAGDIIYHSAGNRGDELWFGRGSNCSSGCVAPYIARVSSSGGMLSPITAANSPLPFTNATASPFARAIFTDTTTGNTFVGLNSGGIGVYKSNGTWKLLNSTNSPLPAGAAVNFNAIANVYGEIWIGTNMGVFVYNGTGSLDDNAGSFKMLTIANGLPGNSITDIAVDTARSFIWVTSSVGVSRAPYVPPFIKGIVYNVFCNRPGSTLDSVRMHEGLQKQPMGTGVKVMLIENGVEVESSDLSADGVFELKLAEEDKVYTVEVKFKKDDLEITYKYPNIKNHTLMGAILIPDSLIREIKAFKPKIERRCFKLKLPFLLSVDGACRDGFTITNYDEAYEPFFNSNGITTDHKKRVENLANFYVSLATVYSLGGTSTDLMNESVVNGFDAIESLGAFVKFGGAVKDKDDILGEALENAAGLLISSIKLLKEGFVSGLNYASTSLVTNPQAKSIMDDIITCVSDAADLSIDLLEKGKKGFAAKITFDILKKELALQIAASSYKSYCLGRHQKFVLNAATSSKTAYSAIQYDQTYNQLYNPAANSLEKYAKDTFDARKAQIDFYGKVAKVADAAAGVLDAATALSLIPGGQLAGAIAKGLAITAKIVKTSALGAAMIEGVSGCIEVAVLSNQILPKAGFISSRQGNNLYQRIKSPPSQLAPTILQSRKDAYNQKLTELKTIFNAPVYDSVAYFSKYKELAKEDSLYTDEMTKTLKALWASTDSAVTYVPGFTKKLGKVIDSFITKQYSIRHAFYYQNLGYIFDTDKASYAAELTSLSNEIILLNDSAVNGITYLVDDINSNGIAAPAYLAQDGYKLNHTHEPGSAGTVTYTFKNYGTQPLNNVSFKITRPTVGYIFTSADSIYTGTILAGESKQISFSFLSPQHDSVCRYTIDVKAANGSYKDVTGSLYVTDPTKNYSVKAGNWSDAKTWSNNTVPTNTSKVIISHAVVIDVDATCKSITANIPGAISVATGKKLTLLK